MPLAAALARIADDARHAFGRLRAAPPRSVAVRGVLAIGIAAAPSGLAGALRQVGAPPTCAGDLAALDAKVRADYAGFLLEIRGPRREAFDRMLAAARARAANAAGPSCLAVLQDYLDFFADPHLFIYQGTRLDTAETSRRARAVERVALTEPEVRRSLARRGSRLDPIEGIWYDRTLRVAIVRDAAHDDGRHFEAVVLAGDTSIWRPGDVRARFTRTAEGRYEGRLRERNYAERLVRPEIFKRLILRLAPGNWGRAFPVAPPDRGLLDPVDPGRPTLVERDGALVLSIPSHDPDDRPALDSLLASHRPELMRAGRLIVDLRGNDGGSSTTTAALLPYIATDSQRPPYLPGRSREPDAGKGLMLSSPDQIAYAVRVLMGGDTTDPSARRFLERMRAHPGSLVPFADTLDPRRPVPRIVPLDGPRHVGILVDHGTVSAAEVFLLEAMRSTRVTTFGEPTAGALDYQSIAIVRILPDEQRWYLGYPTITAQPDLPVGGIRGRGIRPDVPLDLTHEPDPIARVAAALTGPS
jgi:hypothetical protein